jgi:hypothetical protein
MFLTFVFEINGCYGHELWKAYENSEYTGNRNFTKTRNGTEPYLTSGSLQPLLVNHTYVCRTIFPSPCMRSRFTSIYILSWTMYITFLFSRSHPQYLYLHLSRYCRCSLFTASKKVITATQFIITVYNIQPAPDLVLYPCLCPSFIIHFPL